MIRTFDELQKRVRALPKRKLAVAAANDLDVLKAVLDAVEAGLVDAILVGKEEEIKSIAAANSLDLTNLPIVDAQDNAEAARKAVALVSSGEAHLLMKGIVDTPTLLRAVLDREIGLRTGRILSHIAILEVPALDRLIFLTDAAMNINPNFEQKVELLQSALTVARAFEVEEPKVVPLAAIEQVNPKMQATIDADALREMGEQGLFGDAIISGPLAFDGALSLESAQHKGIDHPAAGRADVVLAPYIEAGNVMYKSLIYFADATVAGIVVGASRPIVLTSRSDSPHSKLVSIAAATFLAGE